jgi:hypothetical protein
VLLKDDTLALMEALIIFCVGRESQQDLFNLLGATYAAVFFLGAANCITVQPVVAIERTVFYREKAAGMYSPLSYALAQVNSSKYYIQHFGYEQI